MIAQGAPCRDRVDRRIALTRFKHTSVSDFFFPLSQTEKDSCVAGRRVGRLCSPLAREYLPSPLASAAPSFAASCVDVKTLNGYRLSCRVRCDFTRHKRGAEIIKSQTKNAARVGGSSRRQRGREVRSQASVRVYSHLCNFKGLFLCPFALSRLFDLTRETGS